MIKHDMKELENMTNDELLQTLANGNGFYHFQSKNYVQMIKKRRTLNEYQFQFSFMEDRVCFNICATPGCRYNGSVSKALSCPSHEKANQHEDEDVEMHAAEEPLTDDGKL